MCLIEAVVAPAALFLVAVIAGGSGITGGLSIIDLDLPDDFGLQAGWPALFRLYDSCDVHR